MWALCGICSLFNLFLAAFEYSLGSYTHSIWTLWNKRMPGHFTLWTFVCVIVLVPILSFDDNDFGSDDNDLKLFLIFTLSCSSWRSILRKLWRFSGHRTTFWRIIQTPTSTSTSQQTYYSIFRWMPLQTVDIVYMNVVYSLLQHSVRFSWVWWLLPGKWPLPGVQQSRGPLFGMYNTPTTKLRTFCITLCEACHSGSSLFFKVVFCVSFLSFRI